MASLYPRTWEQSTFSRIRAGAPELPLTGRCSQELAVSQRLWPVVVRVTGRRRRPEFVLALQKSHQIDEL